MASFTDSTPQFNPYISQLPVEAMVKVGMAKQQKYEEGVTKIQSYIDSIAGLDVMRGVDKGYLQNKLNELGNNLRVVAGGDFSNFQLVNSVSGMTTQITKDKFVRAAVQSTAHHRQEMQRMEDDRKNGKLTPDNENHYNKKFYEYLNDNNLGREDGSTINFNASYVPHFDVFKFAKETFDAVKPDGFSFDQVYVTDDSGKPILQNGKPVYSPVLIRMEKEGIFPAKVKETLDQIFSDPRVGQQLQITGEYNFRNYTPEALMSKVNQQRDSSLATVDNMILELNIKKGNGQDVQSQIDELKKKRDVLLNNYYEYGNLVNNNPDAVRGQLYKDETVDRYTTMFGWVKTKETQNDNPGWKANFEMIKEANQERRFAQRLTFDKQVHADEMLMETLKLEQGKKKGKGAGGGTTTSDGRTWEQGDQPSAIDMINQVQQDYDVAKTDFLRDSDEFIWQNVYAPDKNNEAILTNMIRTQGLTRDQAISRIIDNNARQSGVSPEEFRATWGDKAVTQYNKLTPQQKKSKNVSTEAYNTYKRSRDNFNGMKTLRDSYIGDAVDLNIDRGETIKYKGKTIELSPTDIIDLALYHQGEFSVFFGGNTAEDDKRSKAAYQRLVARGLGDVADVINRDVSLNSSELLLNPGSTVLRAFRQGASDIVDVFAGGLSLDSRSKLIGRVKTIRDKLLDSGYQERLEARSNDIRNRYGIRPNLKTSLLTGDGETDKNTLYQLRRIHAEYQNVGNLSYDFKDFADNLPSADKLDEGAVSMQSIVGPNGETRVEVITYDKAGKRTGGLTLSPEEALNNFGVNVDELYEPRTISTLKNIIVNKGNKSCNGDINDPETYESGDYVLDNQDFAGMAGANYDVKVNFRYFNGKYFPYVYVHDGVGEPKVKDLPGDPDLQTAMLSLDKYMTPQFAQLILNSAK